jgi:hypothetical protein
MSKKAEDQYVEDEYVDDNGSGENYSDNDYKSRTGQQHIPVQRDDVTVESPYNSRTADSDEQLGIYFLLNIQCTDR